MENNENFSVEATIPTQENVSDAVQNPTEDSQPQQDAENEEVQASAENEQSTDENQTDGESATDNSSEATPFSLDITYNKEKKELNLEDARRYAQMGMKYETVLPTLERVAQRRGKSIDEVIHSLAAADEELMKSKLTEQYGYLPDEVMGILLEKERANEEKAFEETKAAQRAAEAQQVQETHKRIADEFISLQEEFPELADIEAVPDSVIRDAVNNGRNLVDAYLRHLHAENKKTATAAIQAESAKKSATGSLHSEAVPANTETDSAFLKGVWG